MNDDDDEQLEADIAAADIAAAYVDALDSGDAGTLADLLADGVTFVSPFSTWTSRADVVAACTARTTAFTGPDVVTAVREGWTLCARWRARVGDTPIEGVDVVTLGADGVRTVDVFLRPAAALDEIRAAMTRAWPARRT